MKDQFIETWLINNRVNLTLLDAISDEGLFASFSDSPGKSPARQFAHLHNVRFWKLEKIASELVANQKKFSAKEKLDRDLLRYRLIQSSEAITKVLECSFDAGGALTGYRRGGMIFLGYLIAHESHHRGQMILTLKKTGHALPKAVTYDIWDWNKI